MNAPPSRVLVLSSFALLLPVSIGAEPNTAASPDPLLAAAWNGDLAAINQLLASRPASQVDVKSAGGAFPLDCKAFTNPSDGSDTALHLAAYKGSQPIVEALVKANATLELYDNQGATPLDLAACQGNAGVAQYLLDNPVKTADVNANHSSNGQKWLYTQEDDNRGKAALHFAAIANQPAIVTLLLKYHANPDVADNRGKTALHYAAAAGYVDVVNALLSQENGPNFVTVDIPDGDKDGHRTPLQLARSDNDSKVKDSADLRRAKNLIIGILLAHGADRRQLPAAEQQNYAAQIVQAVTDGWALKNPQQVYATQAAPPVSNNVNTPPMAQGSSAHGLVTADVPLTALQGLENNADPAKNPDPAARHKALHELNLLHDPDLVDYFAGRLNDPNETQQNRDEAAIALGSILGSFKAQALGNDWAGFNAHAPAILHALRLAGDKPGAAYDEYRTYLAMIPLMDNPPVSDNLDAFFGKFNDPADLLAMIGFNTYETNVGQFVGVHSDAAAKIVARIQSLPNAPPVTKILQQLADTPETRSRVIVNLTKYGLLTKSLDADPALASALPGYLFSDDSLAPGGIDAYRVAEDVMAKGGTARKDFLDAVDAMITKSMEALKEAQGRHDAAGANAARNSLIKPVLYLRFSKNDLPPGSYDALPQWIQTKYDKDSGGNGAPKATLYADWKAKKFQALHVVMIFTQKPRADELIRNYILSSKGDGWNFHRLATNGDARAKFHDQGWKDNPSVLTFAGTLSHLSSKPKKPIRIDIVEFNSDSKNGWVKDKDSVGAAIEKAMTADDVQVVFYRGHVGDYTQSGFTQFRGKVYGDLGCYSDATTMNVMSKCTNCAFFNSTEVSNGERTDGFLGPALESLAEEDDYPTIRATLQARLPKTFQDFSGSFDPATIYGPVTMH